MREKLALHDSGGLSAGKLGTRGFRRYASLNASWENVRLFGPRTPRRRAMIMQSRPFSRKKRRFCARPHRRAAQPDPAGVSRETPAMFPRAPTPVARPSPARSRPTPPLRASQPPPRLLSCPGFLGSRSSRPSPRIPRAPVPEALGLAPAPTPSRLSLAIGRLCRRAPRMFHVKHSLAPCSKPPCVVLPAPRPRSVRRIPLRVPVPRIPRAGLRFPEPPRGGACPCARNRVLGRSV